VATMTSGTDAGKLAGSEAVSCCCEFAIESEGEVSCVWEKLRVYFETSPALRLLRSPNAPFHH
jgi:hypothetical protein